MLSWLDIPCLAFFDTEQQAYRAAMKAMEEGTFLIQHCILGPESYTQTFYSRVGI